MTYQYTFSISFHVFPRPIGNVYIADYANHRIRKITASTDVISTIAGTGAASYSSDNVQATSAALKYPYKVALDASGILYNLVLSVQFLVSFCLGLDFYIADCYNHRIRKVTVLTGIITTIAGTGTTSFSGDNGEATSATLYYPTGVAVDSSGILYFSRFCHV